jgi:hypothetical protein
MWQCDAMAGVPGDHLCRTHISLDICHFTVRPSRSVEASGDIMVQERFQCPSPTRLAVLDGFPVQSSTHGM